MDFFFWESVLVQTHNDKSACFAFLYKEHVKVIVYIEDPVSTFC